MQTAAITDHGHMYGYFNYWTECKYNDLKPIIGSELYVAERTRFDKNARLDKKPYHLIALAKNEVGFHNLIKLTSKAQTEGYYYKPRVDHDLLKEYSEGLIILSACLGGEVPRRLAVDQYDEAKEIARFYQETFGKDNYFIEIQRNGIDEQAGVNSKLLELAKDIDAPIVATCDTHFMEQEDWKIQEVVWAIADGKKIDDETRRRTHGDQFYLKSSEEMEELFSDLPEAIDNTQRIAESIEKYDISYDRIQPKFWNRKDDDDPKEMLREITYEGAKKRYGEITPELKERIDYELDVINMKGYNDYFLVVGDIMQWARRVGMTVGARGSAGGSVVAYCNDIINIEPIGWECYFERFLNPERPSPPDIDMDIQDDRRDEMLNYVKEKYGEENFAAICAIGRMKTKAAIRDVARVMDVDLKIADKLSKLVHVKFGKVKKIKDMMNDDEEFAGIINSDPKLIELKDVVAKVEGIARHMSTHACGYLVTPTPIIDFTPVQREAGGGDKVLTQIEGYPLEETGLMKFDFLGLRNLTIITNILKTIEETKGLKMTAEEIPLKDKKTFKLFSEAKTTGVFQFESDGMKKYLKELQPESVEDLCFMAAAYRPGPMQYIPDYIAIKNGQKEPEYLIPELKPIVEKTNGFAIYQEQVIRIAVDIAGYSMGGADLLRRAMGKKKLDVMKQEEPKFKEGVMKLGYDKDIAEQIWQFLLPFADYGFNKAHAAGYAVVAYWTAYLKAHYPQEFIAGVLRSDIDDTDRIVIDMQEAENMGLEVLPPSINKSQEYFSIEGEKGIRFGLAGIKNVGHEPIKEIIKARDGKEFTSLDDLLNRCDLKKVNKKTLECLIKVGAMEEFGERNALLQVMQGLVDSYLKKQTEKAAGQTGLFDMMSKTDKNGNKQAIVHKTTLPKVEPAPESQKLEWEKELVGVFVSTHPLKHALGYFQRLKLLSIKELLAEEVVETKFQRKKYKIGCMIESAKQITTKNGDPMMFVKLTDFTGTIEGVIFPKTFKEIKDVIQTDVPVSIKGSTNERNGETTFIIDFVKVIDIDKAALYEVEEQKSVKVNDSEQVTYTSTMINVEGRTSNVKEANIENQTSNLKNSPPTKTYNLEPRTSIEIYIPKSASKAEMQNIKKVLKDNPGDVSVTIFVPNGGDEPKKLKLKTGVAWNDEVVKIKEKYSKL